MGEEERLDVRLRTEGEPDSGGPPRDRGDDQHDTSPRRRSRFRRALGGIGWLFQSPAEWLGWRSISAGADAVGRLYRGTRAGQKRDRRFKTQESYIFDLVGTAFAYGISPEELERRLAARRRQTAILSYALFLMACGFVLAWACVALRTISGGGRVVLLLQFLPFCILFYLMSFYQALINFQIRTGRAANWREYLTTEDGFLPRW
jgi:hypothetical protein